MKSIRNVAWLRSISAVTRWSARMSVNRFRSLVRNHRGATAVEFALVFPVMLVLCSGIVEFGWLFYVQNSMTDTARTVTRDVSVGTVTSANAQAAVLSKLSDWGYNFSVTVTDDGTDVTIAIGVPRDEVALANIMDLFGGGTLNTAVTMQLEPS